MFTLQCDIKITKSLQWLRGKRELCDIVVMGSDGQQTAAHSCVLAAHSTVIASVLQGRLAEQRDWSVLRPLIISIDDVPLKSSSTQQDGTAEANMMEALIGLLYGETISVSSLHLASLNQYAQMLGLSHQICACLEMNKEQNVPVVQLLENDGGDGKSYARKKHRRKPVLTKSFEQREEVGEAKQAEQVNEGSLVIETIPDQISEPLQSKQSGDYPLLDSLGVKVECDNGILELSMLCSDVHDMGASANSNWTSAHCREEHVSYEQPLNSQIQEANVNVSNCENPPSLGAVTDLTTEATVEQPNIKMQVSGHTETESDGNIHSANDCTGDILSLVVNTEEEEGVYCREALSQHQKKQQKHKSMGKGLVCTVCSCSFQRCGDLVKHVQNAQHFTHKCPLCFVQVRELEGQRLHFALHDQELPFFCMYCDLRFRTRAALTMHAPKHSTTKPFVCNECGRGFKWRHALQAHSYTHSPTSRLLCDICGFSSKYISSFKAHLMQHSGRAFPCPHPGCAFTSSRKTHLNDHLATHSKTRVHQCEVCGHSFSHAKNMRRHMRLHAPASNLLTCTVISKLQCNFRTTRPDKLRDHLSKKHNLNRHTVSSDPLAKLLSTSTSPVTNEDGNLAHNSSLDVLQSLDGIKSTSEADFTSIMQESNADMPDLDKIEQKTGKLDSVTSVVVKNKRHFQSSGQVDDSQLRGHTDVPCEQETFSVLVSSPGIVELPDIQTLENEACSSVKQHNVTEIADSFPTGFLVEHDILLDKTNSSDVNESQHLQTENSISALENNLITHSHHKLRLSVNDPVQDEGNLDLVSSSHVDTMSYSDSCNFSRTSI
ncbi:myoneurin-like isoform X2 [Homarus americanus]|uniref:myoneurin-like isoform X2 n=1 Tax=Homarus americanus TaxID=6706 RepID=UPI001C48A564|nr:myoneurin-like isoform X2 [Homarus americanus]